MSNTGLILFELTYCTPNDDDERIDFLMNIRELQFPLTFDQGSKQDALIKRMLSCKPEERPEIKDIILEMKHLIKGEARCKNL